MSQAGVDNGLTKSLKWKISDFVINDVVLLCTNNNELLFCSN